MNKKVLTFSELMQLPGMQYINRTHRRTFSTNIFTSNAAEFRTALELHQNADAAVTMHMGGDRDLTHQFHREIARLLHNYLAGAMTLVDHTRVFVDKNYEHTSLRKEFKTRVDKAFANNPLTRFVQDLRNYMIHRGPPPVNLSVSLKKGENGILDATSQVGIKVSDLLEWKGWKAEAKTYLAAAGDVIDIYEIERDYTYIITSFHDELNELIRDFHAEEIAFFQSEYDAFQAGQDS